MKPAVGRFVQGFVWSALLLAAAFGEPGTAQEPISTLKISVQRVAVDVVVTDAAGRPVKGLTADDFRLAEDGVPQELRSFTSYSVEAQPRPVVPKLPPNTFSNFAAGPSTGPATVILYDLLNTPVDAQPFSRQQLLGYLKDRNANTSVAIFVLTDRLHMLQGFTDDDNLLIAALNRGSKRAYKSSLLQTGEEAGRQSDQLDRTEGNANASADSRDSSYQAVSAMLKHMETMESSALLDRRVQITADALVDISSFLTGLPGRKNLLWLSGSFPAGILPDPDLGDRDSLQVTRTYSATIRHATDALTQSHTAVYPVDVRGLQANPMFSASSNINFPPGSNKDVRAVRKFSESQGSEHATMDTIADDTGGHAFYNTNGLKQAVGAAMEDGSTYYALTYASTNAKQDGGLRHLQLTCRRPSVHLAYRKTYFAGNSKPSAAPGPAIEPMGLALRHGAPPAHELFFEVHLQTEAGPTPATPQQRQMLAQYHPRNHAGDPVLMQHYLVSYALLGRQIELPPGPDGVRRGNLEFAVMAFDDDGDVVDGIRTTVNEAIPAERLQHIQQGAYEILQRIDVPTNTSALRIGVRDLDSGRIGSMEVALPLSPSPAAPQAP